METSRGCDSTAHTRQTATGLLWVAADADKGGAALAALVVEALALGPLLLLVKLREAWPQPALAEQGGVPSRRRLLQPSLHAASARSSACQLARVGLEAAAAAAVVWHASRAAAAVCRPVRRAPIPSDSSTIIGAQEHCAHRVWHQQASPLNLWPELATSCQSMRQKQSKMLR